MDNKFTKMFENISLWWKFDGRYYPSMFVTGVKNLIKWFKIIWKDRDYDDHFIFEVLKFKIQKTADYMEKRKHFVGWEVEVQRMRTCIKLIDRVQSEYYGVEYLDYENSDYNFVESDKVDEYGTPLYELQIDLKSERYDDYISKYPLQYKKLEKSFSERGKGFIVHRVAHINHERARKLLFKIIETHIEHWWN